MKKIIGRREYDTGNANLIKKFTQGGFGDPCGYEESLYETPDGKLFLYFNGGSESPYDCEGIKSISRQRAELWIKEHWPN